MNPSDRAEARLLLLAPEDNVCAAATKIRKGAKLQVEGVELVAAEDVEIGHKIARREIAAGDKVFKYGAAIGSATRDIQPGERVHLHNMQSDYLPTRTRGEWQQKESRP